MKLDECIKLHMRMGGVGAAVTCVFCLVACGIVLIDGYNGLNPLAASAGAALGLSLRGLKKIFYSSLYGSPSTFYGSLPVSAGTLIFSKIFTAGCFLFLGVVCFLMGFTPMIAKACWGITEAEPQKVMAQLLVNMGYHPMKTPLFAAVAFLGLAAFFYAAAAVIQWVIVLVQSRPAGGKRAGGKRAMFTQKLRVTVLNTFGITAGVLTVILLNGAPYWWLAEKLPACPVLAPAAALAVNLCLTGVCIRQSVRLIERRYRPA